MSGVLRLLLTLALLAALAAWVDMRAVLTRVATLDLWWFTAALLVSVPQYMLSAARWRLTASRLGADLSFKTALGEYYLAVLGNQLLPGGVLGDAGRVYRHGRTLQSGKGYKPALRAVLCERLSGQLMLFVVMLPGLAAWPLLYGAGAAARGVAIAALIAAGLPSVILLLAYVEPLASTAIAARARDFLRDTRHSVLAPDVIGVQAVYSLSVLATYLIAFYCAGRAAGVEMTSAQLVTLVPVVLFAMVMPLTVGGWGIREGAAGAIWTLAGLDTHDGVAASIAYGLVILVSALPGIAIALGGSGKSDFRHQR